MKEVFGFLVLSITIASMSCSPSFPCTRWCWSHAQSVPDLTGDSMTGLSDGRFDLPCTRAFGPEDWYPPLPQFGWYTAETCLDGEAHHIIERTVAAIQDPTIDATEACDLGDLQRYAELVQELAAQARQACVDHLTCKGSLVGCDIDPTIGENQACSISSAESLCDQVVLAPALAALGDLSNGPEAAQPQLDGTVTEYLDDPADCVPLGGDTDGMPVCEDVGDGGGLDESGTPTSSGTSGQGDTTGKNTGNSDTTTTGGLRPR